MSQLKQRERKFTLPSPFCFILALNGLDHAPQKLYTGVSPYLQGIHSRTPGGCLKPQIISNPTYTMFFLVHTYLFT